MSLFTTDLVDAVRQAEQLERDTRYAHHAAQVALDEAVEALVADAGRDAAIEALDWPWLNVNAAVDRARWRRKEDR